MLAKVGFALAPETLINLAKAFLTSRGGFGADPDLMADDFQFAGPVVGPLSKDAFVTAISSVDIKTGFPDFNPEFYVREQNRGPTGTQVKLPSCSPALTGIRILCTQGFRVDPFEGNRVWYMARGRGTNTGPLPPFANQPTGKALVNPPQACSLTFDESGLVIKYTIGYVTDRAIGNTGGLGGLYGSACEALLSNPSAPQSSWIAALLRTGDVRIPLLAVMYAIGKPLPFPEARPWKMSKRYQAFNAFGNFVSKLVKK